MFCASIDYSAQTVVKGAAATYDAANQKCTCSFSASGTYAIVNGNAITTSSSGILSVSILSVLLLSIGMILF